MIQVLSLLSIVAVFAIGSIKKLRINMGLLAVCAAYVLSMFYGMSASELASLFPTAIFLKIAGVMFLFSTVSGTRLFEMLTARLTGLTRVLGRWFYFAVFAAGMLISVSGVSPSTANMILLPPIASIAACSEKDHLLYCVPAVYGIACGSYFPTNYFASSALTVCADVGIELSGVKVFICAVICFTFIVTMDFFLLKGYRKPAEPKQAQTSFERFGYRQWAALMAVAVFIVAVAVFKTDAGFTAFLLGALLILCGAGNCPEAIKGLNVNVLMMIGGMGTLIGFCNSIGAIDIASNALAGLLNARTSAVAVSVLTSMLGLFTMAIICVQTTAPMIPGIAGRIAGADVKLMGVGAMIGAFAPCIAPLTISGALVISNAPRTGCDKENSLFLRQMLLAVINLSAAAIIAFTGIYSLIV